VSNLPLDLFSRPLDFEAQDTRLTRPCRIVHRLFVAHGTAPLYSMRKLQDWTSNQLYRWRAALKKGVKPPSPALRKHIATTGASEESVVAAAAAPKPKPAAAPAAAEGRKPRCRSSRRKSPEAKDATLRVKPTIEKKAAGRAPEKNKAKKEQKPPHEPSPEPSPEPTPEPSLEPDALTREVSITTALESVELPEFGHEEMQEVAIRQALDHAASGQADEAWTTQRQEAAEKQAEPGTSTPVTVSAPVSTPILIPEEPPVQDVEQLLFMEEEPSERSDAGGRTSPVWEAEGSSGVSSPELFSPRPPSQLTKRRSLAPFEDDVMEEAEHQPVMITEPLSFAKADNERTPLTRLTSWSALDSLSNSLSLLDPSVPVSLERCESSKDVDDPAFSNALSEWGSTTLTRQRSWGAPLQPFANCDFVVE
jgi:hypothetical protein